DALGGPADGAEQITLLAARADVRHADAHADAGVALQFAFLDLLDRVGADLDIGIGVDDAREELERAILAGFGEFEEPAFLKGGEDAAHVQSVPNFRMNNILTVCVSTL